MEVNDINDSVYNLYSEILEPRYYEQKIFVEWRVPNEYRVRINNFYKGLFTSSVECSLFAKENVI